MDTVKEESLDETDEVVSSQKEQSSKASLSKSEIKVESSLGSLPSEDISVKDSVRSVDWKYDVQSESGREASPKDSG